MEEKPLAEITLRKYETPYKLGKRELAKKICLSLGLLQTSDNRDVIVDILLVLIEAQKNKESLDVEEIKKICAKYCERYEHDDELLQVCGMIKGKGQVSDKDMGVLKTNLEGLLASRGVESSGGTALWFSDRRKLR